MDTTTRTIELSIPEADMALLKLLAKKLGWTVKVLKGKSVQSNTESEVSVSPLERG